METITIADFIRELKRVKFLVLSLFAVSFVGGMFLFFVKPRTYQSVAKILVLEEGGAGASRGMGALAAMAGIRTGAPSQGLPPDAYGTILESPSFLLNVLYEKIPVGEAQMTVFEYVHAQEGLLDMVRDRKDLDATDFRKADDVPSVAIPSSEAMPLIATNEKELGAIDRLRNAITFSFSPQKPIEVSVKAQDPEVAAHILKLIVVKLETCVKQFAKDNADENLEFVSEEAEKAKQEVYWLQTAVARARDQGVDVRKASVQVALDRLEMDYMDARQRYAALVSEMEAARLKSEKEKQGFVILEAPSVAERPAAPKLPIYFVVSVVLGVVLSISAVFLIRFVEDIKKDIQQVSSS